MEILQFPYQSDLGASGMNPLLELAMRPRPIEDAWGFTLRHQRTLHVGAHEDTWVLARPERSLLVLGPPRDTGKTTSGLVPTVLVAFAPVVAASTKDDVFAGTAQARALMGRLWHFAPDGTEPTPTGARKLRWSPVPAAADWDMAVTTAEVMISVANTTLGGHSADGGFWSIQAGGLLAPLLHAAALNRRDMRTVMRWVMLRDLSEAAGILERLRDRSAGTRTAWDLLEPALPEMSCPATGAQPTLRWRRIGGRRHWRSLITRTSTLRRSCSAPGAPTTPACRATTRSTSTPPG